MLSGPIFSQSFKSVSWRLQKIPQLNRMVDHEELALGGADQIRRKSPWPLSCRNGLTSLAPE